MNGLVLSVYSRHPLYLFTLKMETRPVSILSFVSGEPCTTGPRRFKGVPGEPYTIGQRRFKGVQGEPCTIGQRDD